MWRELRAIAEESHQRVIQAFGGADGVRDLGLLESALHRPRSGYYEDLIGMAVSLFESLIMNHAFVDGKAIDDAIETVGETVDEAIEDAAEEVEARYGRVGPCVRKLVHDDFENAAGDATRILKV